MKKLVIVLILIFSGSAYAATDYRCVSDCTGKGYNYNYCVQKCSYDSPGTTPNTTPEKQDSRLRYLQPSKKVDPFCVSDCTYKGFLYNYCKEKCSY